MSKIMIFVPIQLYQILYTYLFYPMYQDILSYSISKKLLNLSYHKPLISNVTIPMVLYIIKILPKNNQMNIHINRLTFFITKICTYGSENVFVPKNFITKKSKTGTPNPKLYTITTPYLTS